MIYENIVYKRFDTKEEATKFFDNLPNEYHGYCPLIKGFCNNGCVCFQGKNRYEAGTSEKREYVVFGPRCGNAMFYGFESD